MSLVKDVYSVSFYDRLSDILLITIPGFNKQRFTKLIYENDFQNKEFKERLKHTTKVLHHFFPTDYNATIILIHNTITRLREENFREDMIAFMFFPDYIETYGLDFFHNSVKAFEFTTQFISCEFAVRPFIIKYGDKMLEQMKTWSLHKSAQVRRLASEGSRPRLPWAMAIPALKKDPSPLLPILENLKNDPSESVRRSVANNLNDIAKDNPEVVLQIAERWKGLSKETDAIIKHGCRTLLKQGHTEILKHFGLNSNTVELEDFKILTSKIEIGESLEFELTIVNKKATAQIVRLEYGVYYRRQNGLSSKKVFKISERIFAANEIATIKRRQKFIPITTRKYYAGTHQLSIIVNGQEKAIQSFELVPQLA